MTTYWITSVFTYHVKNILITLNTGITLWKTNRPWPTVQLFLLDNANMANVCYRGLLRHCYRPSSYRTDGWADITILRWPRQFQELTRPTGFRGGPVLRGIPTNCPTRRSTAAHVTCSMQHAGMPHCRMNWVVQTGSRPRTCRGVRGSARVGAGNSPRGRLSGQA